MATIYTNQRHPSMFFIFCVNAQTASTNQKPRFLVHLGLKRDLFFILLHQNLFLVTTIHFRHQLCHLFPLDPHVLENNPL